MSSATTDVPYFDMLDPDFAITSDEVHQARERSWYAETNYGLAILRYDELTRLIKHPKLRQGSGSWMALNGIHDGPLAEWWASWILHHEGEAHHRLRRLLNPSFTQKVVAPLAPRFSALANEVIDSFADNGSFDFVSEFADPYVARAISILLGIPEEEWPIIAEDATTLGLSLGVTVKQDLPKIEAALGRLQGYADTIIADRRANDRGDFVSSLVASSKEPNGLTANELRDVLALLVLGGYDTTRNQLGLAMQTFLEYPDQWNLLGEQPELARAAVEEVMRVNPTTRWVTRQAVETFEFQGLVIEEGTTIHMINESAGTDTRSFEEPEFDITAERKPHFGFGGGVHHCLGHFVARSDMGEALVALSSRLRDLRPKTGDGWLPDSGNTGPTKLPITFTAVR
ncbi:cytochrome P450 [Arthrobacter sp. FW306-2-2C-D06B]|uniref:cytochrome P450 n=1 Tax=Arthrobacter sp. FW306-2-2C-D06B TaxID=2879618 RepID=UPI001F403B9F|nr:cytochrome P450 [Arthrobacter sp. FW306-2-2C-D06B]UKA60512.1 cytochrome P450 [Arthrobacter sp. FW306-2-2C-D06B]